MGKNSFFAAVADVAVTFGAKIAHEITVARRFNAADNTNAYEKLHQAVMDRAAERGFLPEDGYRFRYLTGYVRKL